MKNEHDIFTEAELEARVTATLTVTKVITKEEWETLKQEHETKNYSKTFSLLHIAEAEWNEDEVEVLLFREAD